MGILRAWKKFSAQNKNVHLSIGGDGPYELYEFEAKKIGIETDSITFFGEKKWEEIAEMMQKSHCLLMFSNYENLPCVIVEAMASGMAIISTDVGGISEHVDDSRGMLIPTGDEFALDLALNQFVLKQSEYNQENLRKYAEDHFSIRSIALDFDSIYKRVLLAETRG